MTFAEKNNINLMFGCDVARVYYHENEFYVMMITMESITPYASNQACVMAEYLLKHMGNSPTVDLSFNHARGSLSKNKKKKLNALLQLQNVDTTKEVLIRWLLLLL